MARPETIHRRAALRCIAALLASALVVVCAILHGFASSAHASDFGRPERTAAYQFHLTSVSVWHHWFVSGGGDGGPPPPALRPYLSRFVPLYFSYQSFPSAKKPTFSQWLILHGVTDPQMHHAMMLLYVWAERQG